jgi:hypothetical protein
VRAPNLPPRCAVRANPCLPYAAANENQLQAPDRGLQVSPFMMFMLFMGFVYVALTLQQRSTRQVRGPAIGTRVSASLSLCLPLGLSASASPSVSLPASLSLSLCMHAFPLKFDCMWCAEQDRQDPDSKPGGGGGGGGDDGGGGVGGAPPAPDAPAVD